MSVKRHAVAVAACELIPIPLLDTMIQNQIRRNLVRNLSDARGLDLAPEFVEVLADEPLAPVQRAMFWPLKKIACKVFFPLSIGLAVHAGLKTLELAETVPANPVR